MSEPRELEQMARHFLQAASRTCESLGDFSWRAASVARVLEHRTSEIRGRLVRLGLRIAWELTSPADPASPKGKREGNDKGRADNGSMTDEKEGG